MGQKYSQRARADKVVQVLAIPNEVLAGSTDAQFVGKGNLCRIKGTSGGFIKFGPANVEVPSSSTKDTMETEAGYFIVASTDEYLRTSASMRVEVIND